MIALYSDQLQALQGILDNMSIRAAAFLYVDISRVEQFIGNVREFVVQNSAPLNKYTYLFVFDSRAHGATRVDLHTILGEVNRGGGIFCVDENLNLIEIVRQEATVTACSHYTKDNRTLGLRLEGTYFWQFLGGLVEGQDDFLQPGRTEPKRSEWKRPMKEFDQILQDHKRARVDTQAFTYWHDQNRRVLVDRTEWVFHDDLLWWLNSYVSDKLKVYAEPTGHGQGKVDIVVVTMYGTHVLELKWLGKNQNETRYDQHDIEPGLVQVGIYLDRDSDYSCGHLVIYDGRSREEHETHSEYDDNFRHHLCRPPKIIFLENEHPSQKAKRIVREGQRE